MTLSSVGYSLGIGVLMWSAPATAQTALQVHVAEMSVPFGVASVHVLLVADHLVVVDEADPSDAFAIDRTNIDGVDRNGDVVTVTLMKPVRDRTQLRFRMAAGAALARWSTCASSTRSTASPSPSGAGTTDDARVTLQVQHNHRMRGNCVGQLMVSGDRISFESLTDLDHSRQWFFADIREVEQDGIYKLSISPFLGNDYDFELNGRGLNSQEYRQIVDGVAAARAR